LPSDHFWLLKWGSRTFNVQLNEPPLKSLRPFPFHKTLYAPGEQLTTIDPRHCGAVSTPEALLYDTWTILNKMAI
jgi:hypothetical protein